jgi:hypothetical protein
MLNAGCDDFSSFIMNFRLQYSWPSEEYGRQQQCVHVKQIYDVHFSSVLIAFLLFFSGIALGDIDFSIISIK